MKKMNAPLILSLTVLALVFLSTSQAFSSEPGGNQEKSAQVSPDKVPGNKITQIKHRVDDKPLLSFWSTKANYSKGVKENLKQETREAMQENKIFISQEFVKTH